GRCSPHRSPRCHSWRSRSFRRRVSRIRVLSPFEWSAAMATAIRQAQSDDRAAIEACVRAAYEKYIPRLGKEPAPMRANYADLIAQGVVYVIVDASDVRGVVVCFPNADHFFLENIAIDPTYQAQGLGQTLMRFV